MHIWSLLLSRLPAYMIPILIEIVRIFDPQWNCYCRHIWSLVGTTYYDWYCKHIWSSPIMQTDGSAINKIHFEWFAMFWLSEPIKNWVWKNSCFYLQIVFQIHFGWVILPSFEIDFSFWISIWKNIDIDDFEITA